MPPSPRYNLFINQGSTLSVTVILKNGSGVPLDITSSTFAAEIRATATSSTKIVDLTITKVAPYTDGKITISLTAAQTLALPVVANTGPQNIPTVWTYDINKTDGATVVRVLQGEVLVSPEVTR